MGLGCSSVIPDWLDRAFRAASDTRNPPDGPARTDLNLPRRRVASRCVSDNKCYLLTNMLSLTHAMRSLPKRSGAGRSITAILGSTHRST